MPMSDRTLSISSLVLVCAVVAVHSIVLQEWMLDDAFIFFRYAENWVAGHGLVFNPGEPPVEGFTSFLWLALLALLHGFGTDLVDAAQVLGHGAVLATLAVVHQSWRWVAAIDVRTAAVATLLLGTSSSFTTWSRGGMETGLQGLLVAAACVAYLRARGGAGGLLQYVLIGGLLALLGMNRPDGLLVVAVLGGDALLFRQRHRRGGVVMTALVFAVGFGGYYLWRFSYFGYPFPNTFYAKVTASGSQVIRGLDYLLLSAKTMGPILLLWLVSVAVRWSRIEVRVLSILVGVYTSYIIAVGGDVMPAQRFFAPVLAPLCLLGAFAVVGWHRWVGTAAVSLAMSFGLVTMFTTNLSVIRGDVVAFNGRIAGQWLGRHAPPGSTIATNTAGTIVYYAKLRAIDMLGLNDLHIARVVISGMGSGHAGHEKGDGDYVLAQNPEFVQLGSSLGWLPTPLDPLPPFLGDQQLWANPKFRSGYKLVYSKGETRWPGGRRCGFFGFYVRNDLYDQMPKAK